MVIRIFVSAVVQDGEMREETGGDALSLRRERESEGMETGDRRNRERKIGKKGNQLGEEVSS
jgi:hypothetical protein